MKVRNDARLQQEMRKDGIDVILTFSMENVFYLSGALFSLQDNIRERLSAAGMAADGSDFLLCATNETSAIEKDTHVGELEGYVEFERTPMQALADILQRRGLASARIGIEKRYLMAEFYEELAERLPQARFVGGDRAIEVARAIKTPEHIEAIAKASRATERALLKACASVHPGDTERALASAVIQAMFDEGAHTVRHAVITAGDNAKHAHPYPSAQKILTEGDIIRMDIGGLFGGYGSDIARMAIVGKPSAAQQAIYDKVRSCVHNVGMAMKAGMPARAVYQMAVDHYASVGVPGYKRDHVGHSLSILGGHDNPMLHSGNQMPLEPGMVIALEPILRDGDGRRVTVEDTFVIEPGGARMLTDVTDTTKMIPIM